MTSKTDALTEDRVKLLQAYPGKALDLDIALMADEILASRKIDPVYIGGETMALVSRLKASAVHCDMIGAPYAAASCREAAAALASRHQEPVNEPAEWQVEAACNTFGIAKTNWFDRQKMVDALRAASISAVGEQKRYLKDGPALRLVRLRFFRDLVQSERVKVYEAFGIDKDDLPSPLTLGIEQQVFDQLFVRRAASIPKVEPAPEAERGHWAGEARRLLKSGQDALDALDAAEAERDALRKALEPFAEAAENLEDSHRDNSPIWETPAAMGIDACHLRAARQALSGSKEK